MRQPVIFFGHGNPMHALGGPVAQAWRAIGGNLERPKAILMISAHWFIGGVAVTAMEHPRTIHDFGGFPDELFAVQYPAPGAPTLAARVQDLLGPDLVSADTDWGLDHGTWCVLKHLFPLADVPVVQLSLDRRQDPQFHFDLAQRLTSLRDEGVLIAGSGNIVHNLGLARWNAGAAPYPWAERFHAEVKARIAAGDDRALIDYMTLGEHARLSVPTPEHYLPLLYVLGVRRSGETPAFFTDALDTGSISMLGFRLG